LAVGSTTDKIMFSKILVKSKGGGETTGNSWFNKGEAQKIFLKKSKTASI
jgi:hypothetical protein